MPKIPSVGIYIRITDQRGRRHYERLKEGNPQLCVGPKDVYALLYYKDGKQKWEQVGSDLRAANDARFGKQQELLREAFERSTQPDTTPKTPSSLEELRSAFLAGKRKERKKGRTPLDEDTIRSYEWLTRDFIDITKCHFPGDLTGEKVNDWMLVLVSGQVFGVHSAIEIVTIQ